MAVSTWFKAEWLLGEKVGYYIFLVSQSSWVQVSQLGMSYYFICANKTEERKRKGLLKCLYPSGHPTMKQVSLHSSKSSYLKNLFHKYAFVCK